MLKIQYLIRVQVNNTVLAAIMATRAVECPSPLTPWYLFTSVFTNRPWLYKIWQEGIEHIKYSVYIYSTFFLDSKNLLYMTKFKTKNFQELHFWCDKNCSMVFFGDKLIMVIEWFLTAEPLEVNLISTAELCGTPQSLRAGVHESKWGWSVLWQHCCSLYSCYWLICLTTIFWERTRVWGVLVAGRELTR